jgi:hypothetical protein
MGGEINDVVSGSASQAWAVGSYVAATHVDRPLVLRWSSGKWQVVSYGGHQTNTELLGITEKAGAGIWTTGDYDTASLHAQTLVSQRVGSTWVTRPTPDPGGTGRANFLSNIAVLSPSSVLAVGHYFGPTSSLTFSARWNGTSWHTVHTPNPAGTNGADNLIDDAAATSATSAWGVGEYRPAGGPYQPLILRWDGSSWTIAPSPAAAAGQGDILYGVAALSGSAAWAVGGTYSTQTGLNLRTLILRWTGAAWTRLPSP